jgi:hypothetical protein
MRGLDHGLNCPVWQGRVFGAEKKRQREDREIKKGDQEPFVPGRPIVSSELESLLWS